MVRTDPDHSSPLTERLHRHLNPAPAVPGAGFSHFPASPAIPVAHGDVSADSCRTSRFLPVPGCPLASPPHHPLRYRWGTETPSEIIDERPHVLMSNPYGPPDNPFDGEDRTAGRDNTGSQLPSYGDYAGGGPAAGPGDGFAPAGGGAVLAGGMYAGAGKRLGAYLIDSVLLGVVGVILLYIFASQDISEYSDQLTAWADAGSPEGDTPTMKLAGVLTASLITLVLWYIYRVVSEVRWGQTLGKKLLGIRVVDADGQLVRAKASFLRNSWYIVVFLLVTFVGLIGQIVSLILMAILGFTIARSSQGQHTFDQWARTYVVNVH
ncbi:hypothetical protein Csp1_08510 [Corynebacterium provencense]|uniref:RDD domain-containing protein n=2 Tax=Corynebacteriaceae TaxID=1653 RepID=A0A2Z3YP18_9CORY|nr:hypothetical protein Csp1_08510 [Corynebacterium provencense]